MFRFQVVGFRLSFHVPVPRMFSVFTFQTYRSCVPYSVFFIADVDLRLQTSMF
jgi:hypothetical protein